MRIVPFQTLTRYHGYIFRLLWAFLLSLPALVIACVNDDSEFSGKIFSLEETLIVPSQLALNRVKMRSYEHFSLLLGIYHSDFFCRSGKGNEKVSFLCFHTSVTCHLTLSHPLLADSDFHLELFKNIEGPFLKERDEIVKNGRAPCLPRTIQAAWRLYLLGLRGA